MTRPTGGLERLYAAARENPKLRYLARAAVKELEWLPKDLEFKWKHRAERLQPIPGPTIRYRVAGDYRIDWFHESGLASRQALEAALEDNCHRLDEFEQILDFGVGCGRVLRWFEDVARRAEIHGVDIDARAVRWARRHLPFAHIRRSAPLPPLSFPSGSFDLVFSHSVFTHLDADYQDRWLTELRRVTRPGAILLLTVHGQHPWELFYATNPEHSGMQEYRRRRETDGYLFVRDDHWTGIFPDFYHSMFHTRQYIERHWTQYFELLDFRETAMLGLQDIVVLRRPA